MRGREKRQHPRIEVELPVEITVVDVETGQPLEPTERTTLSNISRGGLCAKVRLPQGEDAIEKVLTRKRLLHVRVHLGEGTPSRGRLKFTLPSAPPRRAEGFTLKGHPEGSVVGVCRLAWCERLAGKKGFLMGLAWSEISEENGERLEGFIRGRMGKGKSDK